MIVLYLDYLPVILFGLAGWFITHWVGRAVPELTTLARLGALLAFLSGFYKATLLLLDRGYGVTIDVESRFQFVLLSLGFYYLSLCIYAVNRFLVAGEYRYPSRYLTIVYPSIFLLVLAILGAGFPAENYWGPVLISAMTVSNIVFVFLSCKLALFLTDRNSALLMIAAITLNFAMAALFIFMPLENDFENGHFPNLIREIIMNTLAQGALLWAALRIRERLFNYTGGSS